MGDNMQQSTGKWTDFYRGGREYIVSDLNPGPPCHQVLLTHFFGKENNRMSCSLLSGTAVKCVYHSHMTAGHLLCPPKKEQTQQASLCCS